uniref:Uncharacterized protein n=1 Tax=Helicotheca tamesis TaxID=374047 RepID=A0A7S2MIT9_9STRA|mmetsp:Transcript_16835/g.23060  ORF Transcript_16835/g.23060 Transcript_16835/m.23060 type:complete len:285 (+) Transcript_16835:151-1005(+)|eukprot:CAMPEP_0185733272 /NCGR_PEP_ID=MMETSP1171-20130828/18976_1 /TAXON_ID=374046 /ORGANISM="Helicotheca tamensis, Strain CCMP826" /LENGTH=284 /DNA_ID=CAMNT_0028402955 /DNA_START=103 /DNA_END=960 /DNA_ORIENTATION=-
MAPANKYFLLVLLLMATASMSGRLIESESEDSSLDEVSAQSRELERRRKRKRKKKKLARSKKSSSSSSSSKSKLISSSKKSDSVCRSGKYYGDYCADLVSDCNEENYEVSAVCNNTADFCNIAGLCLAGSNSAQCGYIAGIGEIVLSHSVVWDWRNYSATNRCAVVQTGDQNLVPSVDTPACFNRTGDMITGYNFTSHFNITKKGDVYSSNVTGGSVCEIYEDTNTYSFFNRYIINFLLNDSGDCFEGTSETIRCEDEGQCDFDSAFATQLGAELVLAPVVCPT